MKKYKFNFILLVLALSLSLSSCGNSQKSDTKEKMSSADKADNSSNDKTIEITLNSNDLMQYDKSEIDVFEGQTVILTLVHTGKMPITAMGHNFVLLKKGTSMADFAVEAMKAVDNDYIPADDSNIIVHTKLIGGGEKTSITFKAPEKGTYDFLCSFPGHYAMMKGKFNVK